MRALKSADRHLTIERDFVALREYSRHNETGGAIFQRQLFMKIKRVMNEKSGVVICECCAIADSMWTRGRGLLGRKSLDESEGILLSPGNSIHMFGMKFPIDVIFLTRDFVVADIVENIAPGKAYVAKSRGGKPHAALEIAAEQIAKCGAKIGDQLRLEDVE